MLPIILNPEYLNVLVIGKGRAVDKRLKLLEEAGVKKVKHFENPKLTDVNFKEFNLVYVGDMDYEASEVFAMEARKHKVFVNVEDKKPLCDFHVPAIHRSGNLMITSSTNGTSPRLSRRVKDILQVMFDEVFAKKTKILEQERNKLIAKNASYETLLRESDNIIEDIKLFESFCDKCKNASKKIY